MEEINDLPMFTSDDVVALARAVAQVDEMSKQVKEMHEFCAQLSQMFAQINGNPMLRQMLGM